MPIISLVYLDQIAIDKAILIFVISLILIFLDKFSELEVFGLKMKLQDKINESEKINNQLKVLASIYIKNQVEPLFQIGRWVDDTPTRASVEETLSILESIEKDLGIKVHDYTKLRERVDKLGWTGDAR